MPNTRISDLSKRFILCSTVVLMALTVGACSGGSDGGPMVIHDVVPRAADLTGGKAVRILGSNFRTDVGYTVYFGSVRAESVTILDSETLNVYTPIMEQPAEDMNITVHADNGPAFEIASAFSFRPGGSGGGEMGNLQF